MCVYVCVYMCVCEKFFIIKKVLKKELPETEQCHQKNAKNLMQREEKVASAPVLWKDPGRENSVKPVGVSISRTKKKNF